ncbi:MAG: hypothetical protein C5B48_08480 [Candidatus Rokuibacteriota bacterium]|nr:MAG: hypothetical protein C5B48_08480 [Candidatus Rokubacteria bacterium]
MPNHVESIQTVPEGARALVTAVPGDSNPPVCSVCGQPLRGRQRAMCSGRCRAARSRGKKAQAALDRTRQLRALLIEALRLIDGASANGET